MAEAARVLEYGSYILNDYIKSFVLKYLERYKESRLVNIYAVFCPMVLRLYSKIRKNMCIN